MKTISLSQEVIRPRLAARLREGRETVQRLGLSGGNLTALGAAQFKIMGEIRYLLKTREGFEESLRLQEELDLISRMANNIKCKRRRKQCV